MKRVLTAILLVLLSLSPITIFAETSRLTEFTGGIDSAMGVTFSSQSVMVKETTGIDSLESARIELGITFSDTPQGDSITGMDFYFTTSGSGGWPTHPNFAII